MPPPYSSHGGGTAAATLIAGGAFGYNLLWVAPLSMLLGVAILSAVAHQTLSTGQRPLQAVRTHAGPFYAWAFVLGAVLASVIWHFAQYALASAALVDIGAVHGHTWKHGTTGLCVLAWAVTWAFTYGRSPRLLRWFERSMRWMVWLIVLCFTVVVIRMGLGDIGAVLRGFIPGRLPPDFVPADNHDATIGALGVVVASLAAAVGAMGAALGTMVATLSSHKRGWDERWEEFSAVAERGLGVGGQGAERHRGDVDRNLQLDRLLNQATAGAKDRKSVV